MQPSTAPDDVSLLIVMARRRLKQVVASRLTRYSLGPQQFWVLLELRREEGISLHELAVRTWTDDPTACRMVNKLVERGLIRRDEDPADRRRFRLGLTAKGNKLANELESFASEMKSSVTRGLSGADRKNLVSLLRRVITNTDKLDTADAAPARRGKSAQKN